MTRFDDAWREALTAAEEVSATGFDVLAIRDLLGRVALVVTDSAQEPYPSEERARISGMLRTQCHPFVADEPVRTTSELFAPDLIVSAPNLQVRQERDDSRQRGRLAVLDQGVTGAEWRTVTEAGRAAPHVVTLYGFKGGVGRSSSAVMLARHLARSGRCVLAIDLDWESPGTSAIALEPDDLPEYGIVDHLLEAGVDNVGDLDCVRRSSRLQVPTNGEVWVTPAGGRSRPGYTYIPKLNRAYFGYPQDSDQTFAGRLGAAVKYCVEQVTRQSRMPDVVLLDSRSGIHDLAAVAITQLSDMALLFATDNAQTWSGYAELFDQWKADPNAAGRIRDRLRMVASMVPSAGQDEYLRRFRDRAYSLFDDRLYEGSAAGEVAEHPMTDTDAPHSPLPILFTGDLVGVDLSRDGDWTEQELVNAAFSGFVRGAEALILGSQEGEPWALP